MKLYKHILINLIVLMLLASAACTPQQAQSTEPTAAEETGQLELTLEELSAYNGKDGSPAYVAVDGVIYDVSNSAKWKDGEHNGNSAGQDLTDIIKNVSPHGVSMLSRVPVVGKIVE